MFRILKGLILLTFLAFIGLVAFAYLGDLTPQSTQMTQDVQINVD